MYPISDRSYKTLCSWWLKNAAGVGMRVAKRFDDEVGSGLKDPASVVVSKKKNEPRSETGKWNVTCFSIQCCVAHLSPPRRHAMLKRHHFYLCFWSEYQTVILYDSNRQRCLKLWRYKWNKESAYICVVVYCLVAWSKSQGTWKNRVTRDIKHSSAVPEPWSYETPHIRLWFRCTSWSDDLHGLCSSRTQLFLCTLTSQASSYHRY